MCGYTILTVFENTDTINEPVISLPMAGKMSFRQIGIVTGSPSCFRCWCTLPRPMSS